MHEHVTDEFSCSFLVQENRIVVRFVKIANAENKNKENAWHGVFLTLI